MKYCVTSVMLPELDLVETCALLKRLGYDGLELRVRYYTGPPDAEVGPWGRHETDLSADNICERAGEVKRVLCDHGLELVGFAADALATELEHVKRLVDGAVATGCPLLRVGCPRGYDGTADYNDIYAEAVDAYGEVLDITRGHVRVIVETHGGTIHTSASLAHRLISNFDAGDIGVIYDPQNMVRDGFETTKLVIQLLGPYLAHAHVGGHKPVFTRKDEKGTSLWDWPGCPMRDGLYNFQDLIDALKSVGYGGFISLEDFDPTRSSEEKCADAIRYLTSLE